MTLARYKITTESTKVVLNRGFVNHVEGEPVRLYDPSSQGSEVHYVELYPGDQVAWESEGEDFLYAATQSSTAILEFTPTQMKVIRNGMGLPRSITETAWTKDLGAGVVTQDTETGTYTEDGVPSGAMALSRVVPSNRTWEVLDEGFVTYDNGTGRTFILECKDSNGVIRWERVNEAVSSAAVAFLHSTDTTPTRFIARAGDTLSLRATAELAANSVVTFNFSSIERYGTLIP